MANNTNKDIYNNQNNNNTDNNSNRSSKDNSNSNLNSNTNGHFLGQNGFPVLQPIQVSDYLTRKDGFQADVKEFSSHKTRKTGFAELDNKQGALYPGLYVMGAVSSLGKTTFVNQIADNIAKSGEQVIYFSLEQTRLEMVSKSITRENHLNNINLLNKDIQDIPKIYEYSAIDIRNGAGANDPQLQNVIDNYAKSIGDRLLILPAMFSLHVESIVNTVINHIRLYGTKPVIIIDYLQIIKQTYSIKLDSRTAIDHIVHILKWLQAEYGLVIILISSLNRLNYTAPVEYESFKESGGIEYTADVIWGLQYDVIMNDEVFNKETKLQEKRNLIRQAKAQNPRKITLVCIKNRNGQSGYSVEFDYYSKFDLFQCR